MDLAADAEEAGAIAIDGFGVGVGDLVQSHGQEIAVSAGKEKIRGKFRRARAAGGRGRFAGQRRAALIGWRRAMQRGIAQVGLDKPLSGIGAAIGRFAAAKGYTLIRNLARHGVGRALHEYPEEIATWPNRDRRRMHHGQVLTVEPFLSRGGHMATEGHDGWTLFSQPRAATVQYEHTVVASRGAPVIVTRPG
ncbi:M24 family metallopeptidase [Marinovum algicola]|nr:M24 family metallopeptidase [Marinovum sp. PR37]MDD9745862.1 M24 family metallopeptidase [Marinovum sp. PR37]